MRLIALRLIALLIVGAAFVARILAERLRQSMGQPFIIENRPGAGGLIGIELSGRAPNDGYTLLTVASNITILPVTNKNAKYNLLGDFAPISQLINSPSVLLVNPGLSVNSLIDFSAKAKPGELTYASAGIGTQPHMGMELLAMMVGIRIQHIPASLKKLSRPVWQFITTDQRNSILFCPFLR